MCKDLAIQMEYLEVKAEKLFEDCVLVHEAATLSWVLPSTSLSSSSVPTAFTAAPESVQKGRVGSSVSLGASRCCLCDVF
ncbi:hypothetical protein NDA14_004951 [Ustilago hordei]|nr:hypothetical protein NDA14_004951 [Ustilago hordei]